MLRLLVLLSLLCTISFALAPDLANAADLQEEDKVVDYPADDEVLRSLLNPHQQINDAGEILWNKCIICHTAMPDIDKAKSIKDVKLRFEDDPKQMCYRCHTVAMHPGGAWIGRALKGKGGSPNHLVIPSFMINRNQQLSLKESRIILPFEPSTGKQFCATCHNPHERGLLIGRADTGADSQQRKRTWLLEGETLCQFCHRK